MRASLAWMKMGATKRNVWSMGSVRMGGRSTCEPCWPHNVRSLEMIDPD